MKGGHVLEVIVKRSAASILRELEGRGLVVKLDTFDHKINGRHWHVGFPKQPGVLELTELGEECVLKVGAKRDGGWASALARELAKPPPRRRA